MGTASTLGDAGVGSGSACQWSRLIGERWAHGDEITLIENRSGEIAINFFEGFFSVPSLIGM